MQAANVTMHLAPSQHTQQQISGHSKNQHSSSSMPRQQQCFLISNLFR
jgi:hypothetical protein